MKESGPDGLIPRVKTITKPKWAPDATPDEINVFVKTCRTIVHIGGCGSYLIKCHGCPGCEMYNSKGCEDNEFYCQGTVAESAQAYLDYYDKPEDVAFNRPPVSGPIFDDPKPESSAISYLTDAEARQVEQVKRLRADLTAAIQERNITQAALKAAKRKRDEVKKWKS